MTRNEVLVFRHAPQEHPGALAGILAARGLVTHIVDLFEGQDIPSIDVAAGLIVLGGPMNVDETERYPFLAEEVEVIRSALSADLPVLGICLGSQLLAKTLGARVFPNPAGKELGWLPVSPLPAAASDPLFSHLKSPEVVFHWHGDIFDLPPGAIPLARSGRTPIQAFRFGDRAYGLLFHLEVDAAEIGEWLADPEMRAEAEEVGLLADIETDTPIYLSRLAELRAQILGGFVHLLTSS